jgi:TonB family protein
MKRLIVLSFFLLSGCIPPPYIAPPIDVPQLISMSSLPVCQTRASAVEIRIEVIFRVRGDGSIADARVVQSSGDPDWDAAAAQTMKKWRFTPVASLDDSLTLSVRSRVIVRPEEEISFLLGALVVTTQEEADSLSEMLEAGASFDSLAQSVRWDAPVKRGRYLGVTETGNFPYHIRSKIRALRPEGVTHPLRLGSEFVIYKRMALAL